MDGNTDAGTLREAMMGMGAAAREAASVLAAAPATLRVAALHEAADALMASAPQVLEANARDMTAAEARGLSGAMLDRLRLDDIRLAGIAEALKSIADQPDPVGAVLDDWTRPNGLRIRRVRCPIGVVGVIFESRPNVTADAGALCLKAGNAAMLRGGSESAHSAAAIHAALLAGLRKAGLPEAAIQLVPTTDRAAVGHMLADMADYIDVIVPRGGKGLVSRVQAEARVPVLAHLEGICHVYIDGSADPAKTRRVVLNAKTRRTGICGAAECLLIDKAALALGAAVVDDLLNAGVEVRGCAETQALDSRVVAASPNDFGCEYLDSIIAARVVDGVEGAIAHIRRYGSQHTESILAENEVVAARFFAGLDSAIVMHNASTQFADGGEFGMGAEIGIATGKLHARGPVGANELTTFRYWVVGDGAIRP